MSDLLLLVSAFMGISIMAFAMHVFSLKFPKARFFWRKILHMTAISICAYVVNQHVLIDLLFWVFLLCALILAFAVYFKWLNFSKGDSWGIALFPLAFACLILLPVDHEIVVSAIYVLAFADAGAGLIGRTWGKQWLPLAEEKSWLGSLVFVLIAWVVLFTRHGGELNWIILVVVAIAISGLEMFSWKGSDNALIPLGTALFLSSVSKMNPSYPLLLSILLIYFALSFIMLKRKWLSTSGIIAGGMLTLWILLLFESSFLIYPFLFLLLGSISSKFNVQDQFEMEKYGRTAVQVLSNGSWVLQGGAFSLLNASLGQELFILCFAIACSDTMSSEWGRYFGGRTIDMITLKTITKGLSGGVSLEGTFAGIVGALVLPMLAILVHDFDIEQCLTLASFAFVGMLLDSLIGSCWQAKYKRKDKIVEVPDHAVLVKGWRWMDNHLVNFISIGLILLGFSIYKFL